VPHRYRRGSHGMIATEGEELKMLETTNGTSALTNASAIESLVFKIKFLSNNQKNTIY